MRSGCAPNDLRRGFAVTALVAIWYGLCQELPLACYWSTDCVLSLRMIFDIACRQHDWHGPALGPETSWRLGAR
jgi:hypothetical protein